MFILFENVFQKFSQQLSKSQLNSNLNTINKSLKQMKSFSKYKPLNDKQT